MAINAIETGKLTASEVVDACLCRIAEREEAVRAWHHLSTAYTPQQLTSGRESSGSRPLNGIPVGVKDVIDTVDMPTCYGSSIYSGNRTRWDASSVAVLRRHGAAILGKTTTTEFALREPSDTRNPINLNHSPGGSSSGSAAAVADYMVPLALGSQTVGSTIRPASFCGVYALKPTFGLINRSGLHPLSDSFDTIGIFSRSVEDLHLGLSMLTESTARWDPTAVSSAPRIGFCRTSHWDVLDSSVQSRFEELRAQLSVQGGNVKDLSLPWEFEKAEEDQRKVADYEIFRSLSFERLNHYACLSGTLKKRLRAGGSVSQATYIASQSHLAHCRVFVDSLFDDFDCIVTPSAAGEAPVGLHDTGEPIFQRLWQGLRLPALNIPALQGASGLPIGLQVIGRAWCDNKLLYHSEWIRRALDLF